MTSFKEQVKEWSSPPVDDIGYVPSKSLLELNDHDFAVLIANAEHNRYSGWRNWNGNWRRVLKLDDTIGQFVLDYGSGIGIESIQYARKMNVVQIADISPINLKVAERALGIYGHSVTSHQIRSRAPFLPSLGPHKVDVIHCSGVLHHIPKPEPVVKQMREWLAKEGELRLMLYSDKAWEIATRTDPPEVVAGHPKALKYARSWDGVGNFADWYDADRLEKRFGEWFNLENYEPLTVNGAYVGAVLRRR